MTTIIGVEHVWGCTLMADGLTTGGDNRRYAGRGMEKIVKRGEYLLAPGGAGAACDVIAAWLPPPAPESVDIRWMRKKFVPALRAALREHGIEMTGKEEPGIEVLVAVHGRVYHIASDGTILTHMSGVMALGTGAAYAVGALHYGATPRQAMETAIAEDASTGYPIQVMKQPRPGQETM